jgi:hypothetical protein
MKTATQRKERLLKYSAMAGTAVATISSANAQIVYTDVNPDETYSLSTTPSYLLDLNNDVNVDFVMSVTNRTGTYYGGLINYDANIFGLITLGTNSAAGSTGTNLDYVNALSFGQNIDAGLNWMTGTTGTASTGGLVGAASVVLTGIYSTTANVGSFGGLTDAYVGLQFDIGGQRHYGWARVDVASDAQSFTIKDYAYDATPNTMIPAGATISSVSDLVLNNVNIMQLPNNSLMIDVREEVTGGNLIVTNTTGQTVKTNNLIEGNNRVSLDGLASGIYIVSAQFNEGVVTEKVFVK